MDYQLEDWDWRRAARDSDSRVGGGVAGCLRRRLKGTIYYVVGRTDKRPATWGIALARLVSKTSQRPGQRRR